MSDWSVWIIIGSVVVMVIAFGLPKKAKDQIMRLDVMDFARRKVEADEGLAKEARAKAEADLMERRAKADAVERAKRDALLTATLAEGMPSPVPTNPGQG